MENSRWKANGLPRKGWILLDVVDTESLDDQCEWCGTFIRFIHVLSHDDGTTTKAGCVCAEHLTQDYVNHKRHEAILKKQSRQKKRAFEKFYESFCKTRIGGFYYKKRETEVVLLPTPKGFMLKINNVSGRIVYSDPEVAIVKAWNYLNNVR